MTIASTTSRSSYPGAGAGPFAYPFQVNVETDLLVTKRSALGAETTLNWPADFTVTGVKNAGGGTITLTLALVAGETVVIRRAPALTQATSIRNQGSYFASVHEDEFDRLVMQLQSLQDQVARSIKVNESIDPAVSQVKVEATLGSVLVGTGTGYAPSSLVTPTGVALPPGRTVATLSGYLANNAIYNVKDFGAVGDGATNDAAAIQAAINAASLTAPFTGGRVFLPHPTVSYNLGTTTLNISVHGILLEASDRTTYLKYSGVGYAISFSIPGANQQHRCGIENLGVLVTSSAGSCVYAKSPYGFEIRGSYFENTNSLTGIAITIDAGRTDQGTGYTAEHVMISHIRSNGFLTGILFKGGSLSGQDIAVTCVVEHCFIGSQVGLGGSKGIEFQGSQQCLVLGGNLEVLAFGVVLTSVPSRCISISLVELRTELITTNNWLIPSDSQQCSIISPRWDADSGSDSAPDTTMISATQSRLNGIRFNKKDVACVNGANNHILARGNAKFIRVTGPTAAFAVGGFDLDYVSAARNDGTEVVLLNQTAFAMTITAGDATAAAANAGIRTTTGVDVALTSGFMSAATFIYDGVQGQWMLVSHS